MLTFKKHLSRILAFLIIIIGLDFSAANQNTQFALNGKTIDRETGSIARFVNVFNESKRTACLSDIEGNFRLNVTPGDTLVFYSMVYLGELDFVSDSNSALDLRVYLSPRIHDIEETKGVGFRSYKEFKEAILDLELPKSDTDILKDKMAEWSLNGAKQGIYDKQVADMQASGGGFGIRTSMGSAKNLKIRKVMDQMAERTRRMDIINLKFNWEVVYKLTKLPHEEIDEFILFCQFDDNFLSHSLVSEIEMRILEKLDQFIKKKDSGGWLKEIIKPSTFC